MLNVATLVMVAAAIVIATYSGSILLALAAICGACGIAALMNASAETPGGHRGLSGR
jgi:hypothetical protein